MLSWRDLVLIVEINHGRLDVSLTLLHGLKSQHAMQGTNVGVWFANFELIPSPTLYLVLGWLQKSCQISHKE